MAIVFPLRGTPGRCKERQMDPESKSFRFFHPILWNPVVKSFSRALHEGNLMNPSAFTKHRRNDVTF